jgi:hypothetical protein
MRLLGFMGCFYHVIPSEAILPASPTMLGELRSRGIFGSLKRNMIFKKAFLILFAMFIAESASAQTPKPLDMHGLRPGMSTAEIFLYAHAPLDTLQWGGTEAANVIAFNGIYLNDTGQFRVNTTGPDIMRVNFIAKQRTVEQNGAAYHRAIEKITRLLGKPYQDYHNTYRIITWNAGAEQLVLSTADGGKFYSVALSGGTKTK